MSCNHNYKHINLRRGTYSEMRRQNPLLQEGEIAHAYQESEGFYIVKIGDGFTLWNDLPCLVFSLIDPPTTTIAPCVEAEYVIFNGVLEDISFFNFNVTVRDVSLTEENDPSLPSPSGYALTFTDKPETSPQMSVNYSDKRSRLSYDNYEATVNIYLDTTTGRQTQFGETIPIFALGNEDLELHHVLPSGSLSYNILKTASNDDGSISGTVLMYQSDSVYESGETSINIAPSSWFNSKFQRHNKLSKVTMSGVTVLDWSDSLSGIDIGVNQTTHSIVMGNALPSGHVQRIQCPDSMFAQISEVFTNARGPDPLADPASVIGGNIDWTTMLPRWSGEYDWLEDYPEFPHLTYADGEIFQNTNYDYIIRSPKVIEYRDLAPPQVSSPVLWGGILTNDDVSDFLNKNRTGRNMNSPDTVLVGSGTKLEVLNRFDQVVFTATGPIGLWSVDPDHTEFPRYSGEVYAEWRGSDPIDNIPWEEKFPSGVRHFIKAFTTEEINERFGVDPSIVDECEDSSDPALCVEQLTENMIYRFKGNNGGDLESNLASKYSIKITDTTSPELTSLCDEDGNPPTSGIILDTFEVTRLCEVGTTEPPQYYCVIDKPTATSTTSSTTPEPTITTSTTPEPTNCFPQMGSNIDGELGGDGFSYNMQLSGNGNRVAVGSYTSDGNGVNSGHGSIYEWDGSSWNQLGLNIDGEAAGDLSGRSVSLSNDGQIVAIGAINNDGNGFKSGHVRIYSWNGSVWSQLGADIDGEAAEDRSGDTVSLSADGQTVAIGASYNDGNGSRSGHTRIYSWDGSSWNQLGSDIDGEAVNDVSGHAVSLSADGQTVAIGAISAKDDNGNNTGHVQVYSWNGSLWSQLGADIDGEFANDQFGITVSISGDGNTVAIGARQHDGGTDGAGGGRGHVRTYSWTGSAWSKLGADIDGDEAGDELFAVSLSNNGQTLATGAWLNNGDSDQTNFWSGRVRVFKRSGSSWQQIGEDIDGEQGERSGLLVSLSSDGSRLAVSHIGFGSSRPGHIKVYNIECDITTTIPPILP